MKRGERASTYGRGVKRANRGVGLDVRYMQNILVRARAVDRTHDIERVEMPR